MISWNSGESNLNEDIVFVYNFKRQIKVNIDACGNPCLTGCDATGMQWTHTGYWFPTETG